MQYIERQERLGSALDGRIVLSHTFVAPAFTSDKKSRCDIKFVKWLVRKNRVLSISKKNDEVNDFVDEVTDGEYNLPCVEVITPHRGRLFPYVKHWRKLSCQRR